MKLQDQYPRTIRLGYKDVGIRFVPSDALGVGGAMGAYSGNSGVMVADDLDSMERVNTVLHEVLHAVFHAGSARNVISADTEELAVDTMANGLTQLMRDNPELFEAIFMDIASTGSFEAAEAQQHVESIEVEEITIDEADEIAEAFEPEEEGLIEVAHEGHDIIELAGDMSFIKFGQHDTAAFPVPSGMVTLIRNYGMVMMQRGMQLARNIHSGDKKVH